MVLDGRTQLFRVLDYLLFQDGASSLWVCLQISKEQGYITNLSPAHSVLQWPGHRVRDR